MSVSIRRWRVALILLALMAVAGCRTTLPTTDGGRPSEQLRDATRNRHPLEPPIDRSQNRVCTSAIPASAMSPVTVYATVDPPHDSASRSGRAIGLSVMEQVARGVRHGMGTTDNSLAPAEPRVRWQGAGGAVRVTAYPEGRLGWDEPSGDSLLGFFRRASFEPARIGDCPVRQFLDQAYEFRLDR